MTEKRARARKAKSESGREPAAYTPTAAEQDQLRKLRDRRASRAAAPRIKVQQSQTKVVQIGPDHPSPGIWAAALHDAFGTSESSFADGLLSQLLNATHYDRGAPVKAATINAALAAVCGIGPRDETEAMLAAQMVAMHSAAMELLRRAMQAEYRHSLQDAGNLAVKLLRTYTAQLEALQRYRGKGQQKVTVEDVHVHQGGQAIVGNVEAGRGVGVGASSKTEERPHAKQLAYAPEPTLPCPNPERDAVPVAGGKR
jgi:hypothetical protein